METVSDWFAWRADSKSQSVEDQNADRYTVVSSWENRDVLYSFLGIYTIGLWVFYPDEFTRKNVIIRPKDRPKMKKVSFNFLYEKCENVEHRYLKYKRVNELDELKKYIGNYDLCGNVIPIWPGGNIAKGMQYCFDIPDIYFNQEKVSLWTKVLQQKYETSFLQGIIDSIYGKEMETFLNEMDKEGYKEFLKHCVKIIRDRTNLIEIKEKEQR